MTEPVDRADRELRELFRRERRRDAEWTPSFERVVARRVARRRGVTGWLALAVVTAAAAGILVVARERRSGPSEEARRLVAVRLGDWRTPTDFLLEVPGARFLREVPKFGDSEGWFPLPPSRSPK